MSATKLSIPDIDPDADTLTAALAYAQAGWYVGPLDKDTKHPGSVLGVGWQHQTSRDTKVITAWFAGRNLGVFLHAGRSGAWIADVDHPEHIPDVLARAIATAPHQSTRPDQPGRGHYLFTQPPGRRLGNSTGQLGKAWGEARGTNGIIVVWPTPHPDGGEYAWQRTGAVPVLPNEIAELLTDAAPTEDAVTDEQLTAFLTSHTQADQPGLLRAVTQKYRAEINGGASRHETAIACACWAMREAAAGYYPALDAATQLRDLFVDSMSQTRGNGDRVLAEQEARDEYRGICAWAVAQVPAVSLEELRTQIEQRTNPALPVDHDTFFVVWQDLWNLEDLDQEWLIEDVIVLGRGHAIYAGHKQGKSLWALWSATQIAMQRQDIDVVYLDYEMTHNDLRERLQDMGHGADSDLTRLHYALLPMLPPLDTPQGAGALLDIIQKVKRDDCHIYVIIDTTGRAVQGEENSNDTIRDFYRYTGSALKREGITWTRLDHAGKDITKGQRGGSAKGDDVDVVWKLQADDNGITLHRDASRISWIPEKVSFRITETPLTYTPVPQTVPTGTSETIEHLERLNVSPETSVNQAMKILKEAGHGRRKPIVSAAQKRRKQHEDQQLTQQLGGSRNHREPPGTGGSHQVVPNQALPVGNQGPGPGNHYETGTTEEPLSQGSTRPCTRCPTGIATDISGLCPGCLANPGTLPLRDPNEDF